MQKMEAFHIQFGTEKQLKTQTFLSTFYFISRDVCQTRAEQSKVDSFLSNVKSSNLS